MSHKNKKHFFFDLDNTLTRSRSLISPEMTEVLEVLAGRGDLVAVSGAQYSQMKFQLSPVAEFFHFLSQNGNEAYARTGKRVWAHPLDENQKKEIISHTKKIRATFPDWFLGTEENDLIEDRGSQLSFSVIGHHAPITRKEAFDPTGEKRKNALVLIPLPSASLEVKVGGTTCFDYFARGFNKGFNIKKYVEYAGWDLLDCLYVGDQLFLGGNDDSVIGVCDTYPVQGPHETIELVQRVIAL